LFYVIHLIEDPRPKTQDPLHCPGQELLQRAFVAPRL
jgi:hypothetical protein